MAKCKKHDKNRDAEGWGLGWPWDIIISSLKD